MTAQALTGQVTTVFKESVGVVGCAHPPVLPSFVFAMGRSCWAHQSQAVLGSAKRSSWDLQDGRIHLSPLIPCGSHRWEAALQDHREGARAWHKLLPSRGSIIPMPAPCFPGSTGITEMQSVLGRRSGSQQVQKFSSSVISRAIVKCSN